MRGRRSDGTNPRAQGVNPRAKKPRVKTPKTARPPAMNNDKPVREPVSKSTRFEVFKRDRFTCQYCGAKAPDVILHCDHIEPVAAGGKSDIMNLVTACADCNGGKGARKLDDRSAVERQRAQIEELEERREQLEMMLKWRDQAESHKTDVVDEIANRIAERGGYLPNESGKGDIRRWLARFTVPEVLAALDESFDHYMKWDGDAPNDASWNVAFAKIPAIASLRKQALTKPYMPKLAYVQGILRRRFRDKYGRYMNALEEMVVDSSAPPEVLEDIAKRADDWDSFCVLVEEWRTNRDLKIVFGEREDGED